MKTKNLKVRLFPDPGRIVVGAFVFVNNTITIAEEVTNTSVTVKLGNEFIEFPKIAIKLAKYFAFSGNNKLIGEISYRDYPLIKDGNKIKGEIYAKNTPVEVGDKVRIDRPELHDLEKCIRCQYEGVVVKATSRVFTIGIPDGTLELSRNQFKLINKPNFRNIIHVLTVL